jgi:hypothetical protein
VAFSMPLSSVPKSSDMLLRDIVDSSLYVSVAMLSESVENFCINADCLIMSIKKVIIKKRRKFH